MKSRMPPCTFPSRFPERESPGETARDAKDHKELICNVVISV